jgi:hypothetical protein
MTLRYVALLIAGLLLGLLLGFGVRWWQTRGTMLNAFKLWVADLATTPYRTVIFIRLSVIVVVNVQLNLWTTAAALTGLFDESMVNSVFIFLGTAIGLDVTAFLGKRATAKPEVIEANARASERVMVAAARTGEMPVVNLADAPVIADRLWPDKERPGEMPVTGDELPPVQKHGAYAGRRPPVPPVPPVPEEEGQ